MRILPAGILGKSDPSAGKRLDRSSQRVPAARKKLYAEVGILFPDPEQGQVVKATPDAIKKFIATGQLTEARTKAITWLSSLIEKVWDGDEEALHNFIRTEQFLLDCWPEGGRPDISRRVSLTIAKSHAYFFRKDPIRNVITQNRLAHIHRIHQATRLDFHTDNQGARRVMSLSQF